MAQTVRYRVTGMDCASCAAIIEKAVRAAGVDDPHVSTASQILTLNIKPTDHRLVDIETAVSDVGYDLDLLQPEDEANGEVKQTHMTVGYRRALWIVIGLNVGYGIIEMFGGFLSGSQALKADALDFLGDGLITLLGLLAIGWSILWRAGSALIQGVFLGILGSGVIGTTIYRVFTGLPIEAGLMGMVAIIAFAVNVAAVLILLPHRAGDANVRAVWLFSRNDALGNVAVVVAAGLVAWSGSRWPDLIVAFVIAGLFLQSSWVIVRDALNDIGSVAGE